MMAPKGWVGQMGMKYVFNIGRAKVTQASNVAHGPLVSYPVLFKRYITKMN
jgi:hypothetical protein